MNNNDEKKQESNKSDKSDLNSDKEKKEKCKVSIKFSDNFKDTNNPLSLNYYTKKTKLEYLSIMSKVNYDGFFKLNNSENYLMYDVNKNKLYLYNSSKKTIISKKIEISEIKRLQEQDNYFLIINCYDYKMTLIHCDIEKNKIIIDNIFDLPEQKDLDIHGPFAPYCSGYILSKIFILFHWSTANNFYIYKNIINESKNGKIIEPKEFKNIKLDKKAFIYINIPYYVNSFNSNLALFKYS